MSLSKAGELRREDACADISSFNKVGNVHMVHCHGQKGNQEWVISGVSKFAGVSIKTHTACHLSLLL